MKLLKMGLKLTRTDGEALKKSAEETRQVFIDMGFNPSDRPSQEKGSDQK